MYSSTENREFFFSSDDTFHYSSFGSKMHGEREKEKCCHQKKMRMTAEKKKEERLEMQCSVLDYVGHCHSAQQPFADKPHQLIIHNKKKISSFR